MFRTSLIRRSFALLALFWIVALALPAPAREIVDMLGRTVTVPDVIRKVYGSSPPATSMIYSMRPELLAGINFVFRDDEQAFVPKEIKELPIIGGWFGQGNTPNLETLLQVKPDVMIVWWWNPSAISEKIEETASRLNIPVVYVRMDALADYVDAYLFLGRLFQLEERARMLADYAMKTMGEVYPLVEKIPKDRRLSVYYAESADGLNTDCDKSGHTELINLSGGRNIYQCDPKDLFGMERISIEQVMAADPEVLVVQEKAFMGRVFSDARWQGIRAVKDRRVYLIPRSPFNWFDRPPSFMRLLGLKWLVHEFYPDLYPANLVQETRTFYKLFLNVELDDTGARKVLGL